MLGLGLFTSESSDELLNPLRFHLLQAAALCFSKNFQIDLHRSRIPFFSKNFRCSQGSCAEEASQTEGMAAAAARQQRKGWWAATARRRRKGWWAVAAARRRRKRWWRRRDAGWRDAGWNDEHEQASMAEEENERDAASGTAEVTGFVFVR